MPYRIIALAFGHRVPARLGEQAVEFAGGPISLAVPIRVEWSGKWGAVDDAAHAARRIRYLGYKVRMLRVPTIKQESKS